MSRLRIATLASVALVLAATQVQTTGLAASSRDAAPSRADKDCSKTSVGLTPLNDLKTDKYQGFEGGLYPGGKNRAPENYREIAKKKAKKVKPRAADGKPSGSGEIVLLSIGMSNTNQEFREFEDLASDEKSMDSHVVTVNGAQGGQDADDIRERSSSYWGHVDGELRADNVTAKQVQAVWLKQALRGTSETFPDDAKHLQAALTDIVEILTDKFPNLRLVYVSSRIYAGYAEKGPNPEPFAYQGGFGVKWLIEERMEDSPNARPWVGWGPYMWADGLNERNDGLTWSCDNFESDGIHPSSSGEEKVAKRIMAFLKRNGSAKSWAFKP
jgi:hypothetical protein